MSSHASSTFEQRGVSRPVNVTQISPLGHEPFDGHAHPSRVTSIVPRELSDCTAGEQSRASAVPSEPGDALGSVSDPDDDDAAPLEPSVGPTAPDDDDDDDEPPRVSVTPSDVGTSFPPHAANATTKSRPSRMRKRVRSRARRLSYSAAAAISASSFFFGRPRRTGLASRMARSSGRSTA